MRQCLLVDVVVRAGPADPQARLGKQHFEFTRPLVAMVRVSISLIDDAIYGDPELVPRLPVMVAMIVPMLGIASSSVAFRMIAEIRANDLGSMEAVAEAGGSSQSGL